MALWNKYIVTDVGRALLARSIAHQTEMRISGISTSAKSYSAEVLDSLTALEDIRQSFPVVSEEVVNRSTVKVTANITNKDLAEGYNLTTLGVYATGYDSAEPVLFAVSVAEKPDFLEAGQNGMIRSILTSIYLKTDNAEAISIQVDMDTYVTPSNWQCVHQHERYPSRYALWRNLGSAAGRPRSLRTRPGRKRHGISGWH